MNPASVHALIELTLGGLYPGHVSVPLHCRVRYFDPHGRRAGLPEDVAALVEKLTASETTVTLVNVNQSEPRDVIVQAGGYGEHRWERVTIDAREIPIGASWLTLRLEPGAGARIVFQVTQLRQPSHPPAALGSRLTRGDGDADTSVRRVEGVDFAEAMPEACDPASCSRFVSSRARRNS